MTCTTSEDWALGLLAQHGGPVGASKRVVAKHFVELAALLMEPHPQPVLLVKNVSDVHAANGARAIDGGAGLTALMRAPLAIFQLTSKRIWCSPNVRGLVTRDTLLPPCFIEFSHRPKPK